MTPYEAALNMFQIQQARWKQWVLFYFGAIVSIFVIGEKAKDYVPPWLLPLLCCVVCILLVAVITALRASTDAWKKTMLSMEANNQQESKNFKVFHVQKKIWEDFNHWKDFKDTFYFWKKDTLTSVTRLLILFVIISVICFIALFITMFGNPTKEFHHTIEIRNFSEITRSIQAHTKQADSIHKKILMIESRIKQIEKTVGEYNKANLADAKSRAAD